MRNNNKGKRTDFNNHLVSYCIVLLLVIISSCKESVNNNTTESGTTDEVAKPIVKTALKPAPKAIRSVNIKQDYKKIDHKKNDLHKDNQKNNHKKNDKKDDKNLRPEKIKMERDSFTMPKDEYAQLTLLKARLMAMGQPAKKSELLRAGIKLLAAMSDNTLKTTLAKIPVIKTGRPNK